MASKYGRNAFTVQEAVNSSAYSDYYFTETTDLSASYSTIFDQDTAGAPAKQVIITGTGTAAIASDDVLSIVLNGKATGTASNVIKINGSHLPFTIDGLLITKVQIANDDDTANEQAGSIAFM